MKQVLSIIGRVGKDAEMRYTPSGQTVTNFSVAASEKYTDKNQEKVEKTVWFRISAWGKLAEICSQYVKKGMLVEVTGKLIADAQGNPRTFDSNGTTKATFEVNAQEVLFLSRVESDKPVEVAEDDIPF